MLYTVGAVAKAEAWKAPSVHDYEGQDERAFRRFPACAGPPVTSCDTSCPGRAPAARYIPGILSPAAPAMPAPRLRASGSFLVSGRVKFQASFTGRRSRESCAQLLHLHACKRSTYVRCMRAATDDAGCIYC